MTQMPLLNLSCRELVELVTDYFEGALSPEQRAAFERHVSECDGCASYLEQMRQTIALVGRLAPEHIPPDAEAHLLDAFRGWNSGEV